MTEDVKIDVGHRPTPPEMRRVEALVAPWRALAAPVTMGLEHVPEQGPALLVGNHTVFGVLDMVLMIDAVWRGRGRPVRSLAERMHYAVPFWRDVVTRAGGVLGTRPACRALLAGGDLVLVFPGGGREVAKRKGEKYQLIWKQRMGFARMAIEAGCPIVPFGAVGAEDVYDIVVDADNPIMAPLRGAVQRMGGRWELVWPIARGLGGSPIPRPERLYFSFGEPIDTTPWAGRHDDERALRAVRDRVKRGVQDEIAFLLEYRDQDPGRDLLPRVAAGLRSRVKRAGDRDPQEPSAPSPQQSRRRGPTANLP